MSFQLPKAAQDALKFQEVVLPNGLAVRLLPMPEYGAVHAIYATKFGSINRHFKQGDKEIYLPAGVAHFLEHKMFENEDGVDAFSLYGETGASANAYTGFDQTSYIFTATNEIERNLDILLSFVGHPHFTDATVQKEQGIIAQEIGMYDDIPEMRSVFGILECLYHNHPVRDDIAGSVQSISEITPEILYSCTDAFYTPSNMVLCAAGNISMDTLLAAVERAGLPSQKSEPAVSLWPSEPASVCTQSKEIIMPVAMPMFSLGFKEEPVRGDTVKTQVVCDLITELLFGETSTLYRKLYDEGLVQPDFSGEYGCHDECLQFIVSGESRQPQRVRREVLKEIKRVRSEGVDAQQFEICKNMMYGEAVAELESVERVASQLCYSYFRGRTPQKELAALAAVQVSDVNEALQSMLSEERSSFLLIHEGE